VALSRVTGTCVPFTRQRSAYGAGGSTIDTPRTVTFTELYTGQRDGTSAVSRVPKNSR
jgi:hypothetical protein